MRTLMLNVSPDECDKIFSGEKTAIIRLTRPKLKVPFKAYIFRRGANEVVGEFVCTDIQWFGHSALSIKEDREAATKGANMSREELLAYLLDKRETRFKKYRSFYRWDIGNVEAYSEPKDVKAFRKVAKLRKMEISEPLKRGPGSWFILVE